MNLWILSQDGKHFFQNPKLSVETMNSYWYIFDEDTQTILGEYESEERAIEVIRDIKEFVIARVDFESDYETCDIMVKAKIWERMARVYEIPKE